MWRNSSLDILSKMSAYRVAEISTCVWFILLVMVAMFVFFTFYFHL